MSGFPSKCRKPGCTSFANPATESGLCNKHYAEEHSISIQEASAQGQRIIEAARRAADAEREVLLRGAGGWWEEMRPPASRGAVEAQTLLALGVHPAEPRETKVQGFFEMPNVFLLDQENQRPEFDYSRYVELDWSKDGALERLATRLGGRFDQVAFDWSTMCAFRDGGPNTTSKFNALYKMLKPNGVLFLSESNPEYLGSLRNARFQEVREVPVEALGRTLVELLRLRERGTVRDTVIVGIKREGVGGGAATQAPDPGADVPIDEQLRMLLEIIKKGRNNVGGRRSKRKTRRRKLRK